MALTSRASRADRAGHARHHVAGLLHPALLRIAGAPQRDRLVEVHGLVPPRCRLLARGAGARAGRGAACLYIDEGRHYASLLSC